MKSRDYNLDFFRGIAAIWIIFIHTCFWSGEYYISDYVKSFSLIIDVPLFMFISGAAFNYSNSILKSIRGIVKVWYKYLIFLILYFAIIFFIDKNYFNLNNILNALFFNFTANKLMVVEGSFWFIFMYFIVSILGGSMICLYNKYNKSLNSYKYILILIFILYGMSLYNSDFIFISSNYLLYLFIYCLGYYLYNLNVNFKKWFLIIIINVLLFGILLKTTPFDYNNIQLAKTTSHFVYLVYSLISINFVLMLKDKVKIGNKNFFVYVGQNALLYYFCQGIGASIIYILYNYINHLTPIVIFILMFICNLIVTFVCVEIVKLLQKIIDKILTKLKDKRKFLE